jgi:hypothetical protein
MSSDRETVGRAASWLFAVAALCSALELTGCGGGAPGDAVATVDGEPIERQSFDHWMTIDHRELRRKWRERTECREGFLTPHCKNGPQPPRTERRG